MKSFLHVSLDEIGDVVTFRMTDFSQLRKERRSWQSPPFCIYDMVRVHLAVYPSGVGRGEGSHVSVSFILIDVVKKKEDMKLYYNVSVAAIGQHRSATPITTEVCDNDYCYVYCPFPSPGEVLRSEEQFVELEEANSLLANDSIILELKLLEHQHQKPMQAQESCS